MCIPVILQRLRVCPILKREIEFTYWFPLTHFFYLALSSFSYIFFHSFFTFLSFVSLTFSFVPTSFYFPSFIPSLVFIHIFSFFFIYLVIYHSYPLSLFQPHLLLISFKLFYFFNILLSLTSFFYSLPVIPSFAVSSIPVVYHSHLYLPLSFLPIHPYIFSISFRYFLPFFLFSSPFIICLFNFSSSPFISSHSSVYPSISFRYFLSLSFSLLLSLSICFIFHLLSFLPIHTYIFPFHFVILFLFFSPFIICLFVFSSLVLWLLIRFPRVLWSSSCSSFSRHHHFSLPYR